MKNPLLLFPLLLFTLCANAQETPHQRQWQSVYHHESEGKPISGSKEALINAIRQGAEVRIYYKSGRVEHLVDADFITVFKGEVFAQIDRIKGQRPGKDKAEIALRPNDYYGLYSTNGKFEINWFIKP